VSLKSIANMTAYSLHGRPYIWGGDDPSGFDCSGFVIEILKSVGILPRGGDWTADMLYHLFKHLKSEPQQGCLVFWGAEERKTHVEYCYTKDITIGAAGGGPATLTARDAIDQNAYIKFRPIDSRMGCRWVVDPFIGPKTSAI